MQAPDPSPRRRWSRAVLVLALGTLTAGCPSVSDAPEPYESLLRLPWSTLEDTFPTLSPAQQVRLYQYGMLVQHPPLVGLRFELAEVGEPVVPHVLTALDSVSAAYATADLLDVLAAMVCHEGMDFSDDSAVLATATRAVRTAEGSEFWKQWAERSKREIEGDCEVDRTPENGDADGSDSLRPGIGARADPARSEPCPDRPPPLVFGHDMDPVFVFGLGPES